MKYRLPTVDELAVKTVATVMALCWVYQRRRRRKQAGEGRTFRALAMQETQTQLEGSNAK